MTTTKTVSRTATVAADANPLAFYTDKMKAWPTKYVGPKPTAENFKLAHSLGAKPGTKTAMAIAMYVRDGGATTGQVFNINDGPYLNKMRAIIEAGHAVRLPMPVNAAGHQVYKLALPTKKATKASKPAKATKASAKASKPAKASKADPVVATATVDATSTS